MRYPFHNPPSRPIGAPTPPHPTTAIPQLSQNVPAARAPFFSLRTRGEEKDLMREQYGQREHPDWLCVQSFGMIIFYQVWGAAAQATTQNRLIVGYEYTERRRPRLTPPYRLPLFLYGTYELSTSPGSKPDTQEHTTLHYTTLHYFLEPHHRTRVARGRLRFPGQKRLDSRGPGVRVGRGVSFLCT